MEIGEQRYILKKWPKGVEGSNKGNFKTDNEA